MSQNTPAFQHGTRSRPWLWSGQVSYPHHSTHNCKLRDPEFDSRAEGMLDNFLNFTNISLGTMILLLTTGVLIFFCVNNIIVHILYVHFFFFQASSAQFARSWYCLMILSVIWLFASPSPASHTMVSHFPYFFPELSWVWLLHTWHILFYVDSVLSIFVFP